MNADRAAWMGAALCVGGIAAAALLLAPPVVPGAAGPPPGAEPRVQARLVGSFSEFAGSTANARSLVTGLRRGDVVTLTGSRGPARADARFTPPMQSMTYRDVRVSLALAREQLAQLGIRQPTPAQIKAALAGGAVTGEPWATPMLLPGVLQMRAHGMAWGEIAEAMGMKLSVALSSRPQPRAAPEQRAAAAPPAQAISGAGAAARGRPENGRPAGAAGAAPAKARVAARAPAKPAADAVREPAVPPEAGGATPTIPIARTPPQETPPAARAPLATNVGAAAGTAAAALVEAPAPTPITPAAASPVPAPAAERDREPNGTAD